MNRIYMTKLYDVLVQDRTYPKKINKNNFNNNKLNKNNFYNQLNSHRLSKTGAFYRKLGKIL